MGAGGAKQLLAADPSSDATKLMPAPAAANKSIFYNKDMTPRTVAEVYAEINRRVKSKGKQFGIDGPLTTPATMLASADTATSNTTTDASSPATATKTATTAPSATAPGTTAAPVVASATPSAPAPKIAAVVDQSSGSTAAPGIMNASYNVSPAKTVTPDATTPTDNSVQNINSGFMTPKSRELMAQSAYRREDSAITLGVVNSTLEQSLDVQKSQLEVMTGIMKIIMNKAVQTNSSGMVNAVDKGNADTSTIVGPGPVKPMTRPPLSMAKIMT